MTDKNIKKQNQNKPNKLPDFKRYLYKCRGGSISGDKDPNLLLIRVGLSILGWGEVETGFYEFAKLMIYSPLGINNSFSSDIAEIARSSEAIKIAISNEDDEKSDKEVVLYYYGIISFSAQIHLLKEMVNRLLVLQPKYKKFSKYFNDVCKSATKGSWVRNNIAHGRICGSNEYRLTCLDYATERKKDKWAFNSNRERAINSFLGFNVAFDGEDSLYNYNSEILEQYFNDLKILQNVVGDLHSQFIKSVD